MCSAGKRDEPLLRDMPKDPMIELTAEGPYGRKTVAWVLDRNLVEKGRLLDTYGVHLSQMGESELPARESYLEYLWRIGNCTSIMKQGKRIKVAGDSKPFVMAEHRGPREHRNEFYERTGTDRPAPDPYEQLAIFEKRIVWYRQGRDVVQGHINKFEAQPDADARAAEYYHYVHKSTDETLDYRRRCDQGIAEYDRTHPLEAERRKREHAIALSIRKEKQRDREERQSKRRKPSLAKEVITLARDKAPRPPTIQME